jgi:hypothetical protein
VRRSEADMESGSSSMRSLSVSASAPTNKSSSSLVGTEERSMMPLAAMRLRALTVRSWDAERNANKVGEDEAEEEDEAPVA